MPTIERSCGQRAPLPQRKSRSIVIDDNDGSPKACQICSILVIDGSEVSKYSWRASKDDT